MDLRSVSDLAGDNAELETPNVFDGHVDEEGGAARADANEESKCPLEEDMLEALESRTVLEIVGIHGALYVPAREGRRGNDRASEQNRLGTRIGIS